MRNAVTCVLVITVAAIDHSNAIESSCSVPEACSAFDSTTLLQTKVSHGLETNMPSWIADLLGFVIGRVPGDSTCGYSFECSRDYSVADVKSKVAGSEDAAKLQEVHVKALLACASSLHDGSSILKDGGWCYDKAESWLAPDKVQKQTDVDMHSDVDFYLPKHHVLADQVMVSVLAEKILLRHDGTCCHSLTDLGAGVGQFGHALKARLPQLEYRGYDGAGNIEDFTNNYVSFADLVLPLHAKRTDWVMSSEVGEHIPHKYEAQVIANIHALNCKGVVLTWGVVKQPGHGHINCHSNDYLIKLFEELGYKKNDELTSAVRAQRTSNWWLMNSALVFDRLEEPAECKNRKDHDAS
jgi:hypothetical protein